MRLVIKQNEEVVNVLKFTRGPIYIGRHTHSQVFLADAKISRQHAVIFTTQDGKWLIEDLDSANKTYLNDQQIAKSEIKSGDVIGIADFKIEIDLKSEDEAELDKTLRLEDTLTTSFREIQTIVRKSDAEHAPDVKLPARRIKDYLFATEEICKAKGLDEMVNVLLTLLLRQFSAYHAWCALRDESSGPMTYHAGKQRDGVSVDVNKLKLSKDVADAVEKKHFLLFPQVPLKVGEERIKSAMIAPVLGQNGCFGILYVDNALVHEHYGIGDLDYLMLLAIHTAAIVANF